MEQNEEGKEFTEEPLILPADLEVEKEIEGEVGRDPGENEGNEGDVPLVIPPNLHEGITETVAGRQVDTELEDMDIVADVRQLALEAEKKAGDEGGSFEDQLRPIDR